MSRSSNILIQDLRFCQGENKARQILQYLSTSVLSTKRSYFFNKKRDLLYYIRQIRTLSIFSTAACNKNHLARMKKKHYSSYSKYNNEKWDKSGWHQIKEIWNLQNDKSYIVKSWRKLKTITTFCLSISVYFELANTD